MYLLKKYIAVYRYFKKKKAHEQLMNYMQLAHLHIIKHIECSIVFNIC